MPLLSFCFQNHSIDESGVLKSSTIIVCGAMCALSFTKVCFMTVGALCFWSIDIQNWEFILVNFTINKYEVPLLVFFDNFGLEVDFIRY